MRAISMQQFWSMARATGLGFVLGGLVACGGSGSGNPSSSGQPGNKLAGTMQTSTIDSGLTDTVGMPKGNIGDTAGNPITLSTVPAAADRSGASTSVASSDPSVSYSGNWVSAQQPGAGSGDTAMLSTASGSQVRYAFSGTSVRWIGYRDTHAGTADVYLDGMHVTTVDTYSTVPKANVVLYSASGLSPGQHLLAIQVTGKRNPISLGTAVWVGSFETDASAAAASSPPAPVASASGGGYNRFEQDNPAVSYGGSWSTQSSSLLADYSGGSAAVSSSGGASATLSFTGTAVRWIGYQDTFSGIADVYLDGAKVATVDTYSLLPVSQAVLYSNTGLSAGNHTLQIRPEGRHALLALGSNVWVDAFDVLPPPADTTPPTVDMAAPANGAAVSGTVNVSADASDNVAVASVQFELDGSALGPKLTSAPYDFSWDSTKVANGSHTLTAVATDTSGNQATSAAVTITVSNSGGGDTTPPTVTMTAPANGTTVSGTVTVSADASDNVGVVGVQFQLDGANLGSEVTSAPYTISWDSTAVSNGSHSLTAIARDAAGNRGSANPITVTVSNQTDTTPPTVRMTAPANGATVSGTVTVSANASDNVGVVGVQFELDGAPLGAEITSAPYTMSWDSTTASNGGHSLTAIARDAAGNRGTASAVNVTVSNGGGGGDTTPPTVSMTAPANGATVSGNITVSANASDNVGVVGVQFELDGTPLGAEVTSAPYSITWNSSQASNGSHSLTAIARDAAGNHSTASPVTVTVSNGSGDTTPPTVDMTAPANGATVSGNVTVSADASDNVGVVGVQFELDGAPLGSEVTSAPYTITWNSTAVANGSHSLTAVARDAAGNHATASPVTVTVSNGGGGDTTPPTVSMTAPANGATVSGTVTVSADASDNVGVAGVQFELDGAALGAEDTTAPYSVSWDSTKTANGTHSLTAIARDAAGNHTTATPVTVTVSNGGGGGTTTRYEQDNPAVTYTGTWVTASDSSVSGGTATETNQANATATFTFTGTKVSWIGYRCGCAAGIAEVSVDGGAPVQVDDYSATTQPQAVVFTSPVLPRGNHTLAITVTGRYDPAGSTAYVVVDAFDVTQ